MRSLVYRLAVVRDYIVGVAVDHVRAGTATDMIVTAVVCEDMVVTEVIEQYNLALGEFYKGNPEPVQKLWSHRDDVTLCPPFGPPTHGWDEVAASMERGASQFTEGGNLGFEIIERHVTPEFAYFVRVERGKAKVGGGEEVAPIALRVTMIFRSEEGTWKVVHRHADPITSRRPAESVIQE